MTYIVFGYFCPNTRKGAVGMYCLESDNVFIRGPVEEPPKITSLEKYIQKT